MEKIGISAEHLGDVQGINKYLQDHRINQLFNVSILLALLQLLNYNSGYTLK